MAAEGLTKAGPHVIHCTPDRVDDAQETTTAIAEQNNTKRQT